jgi:protein dithiol:quinone oxidoreductase
MSRRQVNLVGLLACAGLIGYALHAEYDLHLDPCPLCWLQRGGVVLLGLVFLLAAVHNPKGWGTRVYAVLLGLAALVTAGVAARHIYVQHLPPGALPSCEAPIKVLIQMTPFAKLGQLLTRMLLGSGECTAVNWRFMTLTMPEWVLISAVVLGAFGVIGNLLGGVNSRELPPAGDEQQA